MNENERLIKRLLAAKSAIDAALDALNVELQGDGEILKTCPVCGDPIYANQRIQRGVHAKCVQLAANRVRKGDWTQEQMDSALEPPQAGGRKKKITPLDAKAEARALESASKAKKPKKP